MTTTTSEPRAATPVAPDVVVTEQLLPEHEVLDGLAASRRLAHQAAVAEVELAVQWAHLHPCPIDESPAGWDVGDQPTLAGDTLVTLAGPGAPTVAEFALAELSATLDSSHVAVRRLVGESLELVHRLPRLWAQARAGRLPVWRARAIAALTVDLAPDAAAHADRLLAATPGRVTTVHAHRLVDEARLYADPDRAADDERAHLDGRGVWLNPAVDVATTGVHMLLDTRDAHLLDQTLGRLARELRELGDTDTLDVRRATAVGVLADPQHALDLMAGRFDGSAAVGGLATSSTGSAGGYGPAGAPRPGPARAPRPCHTVYVHVTLDELAAAAHGTGVGVLEGLGLATSELIGTWLTGRSPVGGPPTIRVRPVLDLAADPAVDHHDPPPLVRERVELRDAHCVFPGCRRDSRSCDLDHVDPYVPLADGGAPGQTRPSNLAPLCRPHHRVKTHAGWAYRREPDGSWAWRSPTGRRYVVPSSSRRPPDREPAPPRPLPRIPIPRPPS